jgi:5-methyltetrahydrofolate--homocysteine methyltransferase
MAGYLQDYLDNNFVNIIGGCCGTTPDHIHEFTKIAEKAKPHHLNKPDSNTRFSGLEPVTLTKETNFVNIGERCNVSGSRKFARLIREEKFEEALSIARAQVGNELSSFNNSKFTVQKNNKTILIIWMESHIQPKQSQALPLPM